MAEEKYILEENPTYKDNDIRKLQNTDDANADTVINPLFLRILNNIKALFRMISNKVDKVTGKGLSTNDYTTADKDKLNSIETGANNYTHPSTHPYSMLTGAPTSLPANGGTAAKVPWSGISGKPATFPATTHTHDDRYYTEAEINTKLVGKASTAVATTDANGLMSKEDKYKVTQLNLENDSWSVGVGIAALLSETTGDHNICIGRRAGAEITTGSRNIAIGTQALDSKITGNDNTAIGFVSLSCNTTGSMNTALSPYSLGFNTKGNSNTALGYMSLYSNTEGNSNTALGSDSLYNNTTGSMNTAIGRTSLYSNGTGSRNTALGYNAFGAGSPTNLSNSTAIGYQASVTGSNQVQLGDSATTVYTYGAVQNRSDVRDKADIRDTVLGLDFIKALRPVDFKWDYREDYKEIVQVIEDVLDEDGYPEQTLIEKQLSHSSDGTKTRKRYHHGLIAQEVKQVIDATGIDFGGYQDHSVKGGKDVLSIGYSELIAPLIKSVQELSAKVVNLQEQLDEIKQLKAGM